MTNLDVLVQAEFTGLENPPSNVHVNYSQEPKDLLSPEHVNVDLLALKNRQKALLSKKLLIAKTNALALYKPHPKQDRFHQAGEFKRRMIRAGNRFGKSTMGSAEDAAWLLGERTWYPKDHPARRGGIPQHPVKLLVITTDWDKVDEVFTSERGEKGKLWKYIPSDMVKSKGRNHSGVISEIELKNGSIVRFETKKSFESNPQGVESSDWDAIHVDEPCPEPMWIAASRGLMDRDGSAWFTLTPLTEPWINDMFFPDGRDSTDTSIIKGTRKQLWATSGSTYENPTLSPEAIAEFEASLTEDEKQCRLSGIPLFLSGLVYKEFDRSRHVLTDIPHGWQDFLTPPPSYTRYISIDPHPQTPHAVLFIAVSPFGQKFVYDEIFFHTTIMDLALRILAKLGTAFCAQVICDPLAYIYNPISDTCMADEFATHGLYVEKAPKDLVGGILKTKEELLKENNVYVTPNCQRFLWEINRYCWDKDNKPKDKDDHMMECFYRLMLNNVTYIALDATDNRPVRDVEITTSLRSIREY
jgi:hypothetical protein